MTAEVSNVIVIKNPTDALRKYVKTSLVLANPDYEKKSRMGFWTGATPRTIKLYEEWSDGRLVLPYGMLQEIQQFFTNVEDRIEWDISERYIIDYKGADIPIYDYQEKAVREMIAHQNGILQSPAGSGKTQMGLAMAIRTGRRTLWLTHTKDLLNQSKERAAQYMDPSLLGTITEGKVNIGTAITFATIQTMSKIDLLAHCCDWDMVIVDECHRCAGSPTQVTMFYAVLNRLRAKYKYGLSATVHRADGMIRATTALLGNVRYAVPDEAVKEKTMQVTINPIATNIDISNSCLNTDGTLNYAKLISYLTENHSRNVVIWDTLYDNKGESSLILSDRLEHLETLMEMLPPEMRKDAVMISGKMTSKKGKAEREAAIEAMRTGEKRYLFATYSLAKEGLDIPRLRCLYLATPVKDFAVVVQSIGRIARKFPDKKDPICFDFVDNIGYLRKAFRTRVSHYRKAGCNLELV